MCVSFAVLQNKLSLKRLRRYSSVAVVLISCMVSYEADASKIMRGIEYGDISFKRLVSVYRKAYQKAGFKVTMLAEKGDGKTVRLRLRFSPPGSSKKQKALKVLIINSQGMDLDTCTPCSVYAETMKADSNHLERQLFSAETKIERQLYKMLKDYIWYDPAEWEYARYDHIGVDELIASYKQAYTESGFEFRSQTELTEAEDIRLTTLHFVLSNLSQSGFSSHSATQFFSSMSLGCEPCSVIREPIIHIYPDEAAINEQNWNELKKKDRAAKDQVELNLHSYLRPKRDFTHHGR